MKEIWKKIPGIPDYYVSDLGNVKHIRKDGSEFFLKKTGRTVSVRIHTQGMNTTVSVGKMMYSAFNNIDISCLDKIRTTGDTLKELRVFTFSSFMQEYNKSKRKRDFKEVEKMQIEAYEDLKTVIDSWRTNNSTALIERIGSYEKCIIEYTCKKFNLRYSTAKELWDEVSLALAEDVIYKKKAVAAFGVCLRYNIRVLIRKRRERMKRVLLLDENRAYKTE